jgi:hypothetical protein
MSKLIKLNAKDVPQKVGAKRFTGVLQENTGLVWDPRETKSMTHADAEKYIAQLNKDEPGKGWRLPTVDELFALADRTKYAPAIDKAFFPKCASGWYWTNTPAASSPADYAWLVLFSGGNADWVGRDLRAFVRAVRPSQ